MVLEGLVFCGPYKTIFESFFEGFKRNFFVELLQFELD